MKLLSAFIAGLVFGLGLILSGMADPSKVIAFLDLAGPWDPRSRSLWAVRLRSPVSGSISPPNGPGRCWEISCECPPPPGSIALLYWAAWYSERDGGWLAIVRVRRSRRF